MNKELSYKHIGLALALTYWIFDATIHKLLFGEDEFEFIPSDINELWMRSLIVILITLFGFYIDYSTKKLIIKEQEKLEVFQSTVLAIQHVLNNYLHKMQIFRSKMKKCDNISEQDIEQFNALVNEATENIKKLSEVTNIDAKEIIDSVDPRT